MAKPIPEFEIPIIEKSSPPCDKYSFGDGTSKKLVLGTATGWLAGVGVIRVGKIAAFGLGGGILLLHFACELGYVNVNWERIREACARSQVLVENVLLFVRRNSCWSVGFVGGFFFGVASM